MQRTAENVRMLCKECGEEWIEREQFFPHLTILQCPKCGIGGRLDEDGSEIVSVKVS